LGGLEVAAKEHHQPVGGRIDFLMRDTEAGVYYEVEVMLGALDESHIIRTIEYWDLERQRRPTWDHCAVIVAEDITTRFFNVLRLLNRAVPLIAVKLSAVSVNGRVLLVPVTVLNITEEASDEPVDPVERADRAYWEKRSPQILTVMDRIASVLKTTNLELRVTFNRGHIALGTTGTNFCWLVPRKPLDTCHVDVRLLPEARDGALSALQESGIDASPRRKGVAFNITVAALEKHIGLITRTLEVAEQASR
jgi:hypothetical protein